MKTSGKSEIMRTGRVTGKSRGFYFVHAEDGEYLCRASNRLRKELVFPTAAPSSTRQGVSKVRDIDQLDPIAVGDMVTFAEGSSRTGTVRGVLPRKNKFSRMIRRTRPLEQVLAANIDQVVGVFAAAMPSLRYDLLDRVTVQAEILGVPLVLAITKMDLADEEEIEDIETLYGGLGYEIMRVCAPEDEGVDALRDRLAGKITLLAGESGAGKTTLLNALAPGLDLKTGDVRANSKHGRGAHTTSMVRAQPIGGDGWVIDTPGINDLGLFLPEDATIDAAAYFREIAPLMGKCGFGSDCLHDEEPGCAVREAVERGEIDEARYEAFMATGEELRGEDVRGKA